MFAALIAVTAAVVIGLVPALQGTGGDLNKHIKNGQHAGKSESGARERRKLLPRSLMVSEVALALVLVAAAGLLATSLKKLYRSGAGFDPNGVVNVSFNLDKQPRSGEDLMQLYHQSATISCGSQGLRA